MKIYLFSIWLDEKHRDDGVFRSVRRRLNIIKFNFFTFNSVQKKAISNVIEKVQDNSSE